MQKNVKFLFNEEKQTPKGMVSVSQIQTFMSCPKKWEYNYIENLTPRVERSYLSIGKLCHKGMQVAMTEIWKSQQSGEMVPIDSILEICIQTIEKEWNEYVGSNCFLQEEMPDIEQMRNDAIKVFSQAFYEFDVNKYKVLTLYKNGKPIPALELHFVVPCPFSKGLHGFIDAIIQDKETGFTWCTDYKFRKTLSPDEEEAYNIQNAVYCYACNKMGIHIEGTMTWQHSNTPAADPQILKNGGVSRALIKTTWEHYKNFCINNNIDPTPYEEEMKEKLAQNEFFRPTYEYRNEKTINNMWEDIVKPAAKAINLAKKKTGHKKHLYPWNCKMCQYQSICQAELRDYDVEAIKKNDYVVREKIVDTTKENKEITDKLGFKTKIAEVKE